MSLLFVNQVCSRLPVCVCPPVQPSMCHKNKRNTPTSTFKRGLGGGFRCCLGLRAASTNRRLSKGHRNRIHTKLDPAPFLSRRGRRIPTSPENSAFSHMTIILKFVYTFLWKKSEASQCFPESTMKALPFKPRAVLEKQEKKEKEQRNDPQGSCSPSTLSPSALSFMLRRCTLCGPPVFVPDIPAQSVLQCAS